MLIQQYDLAGRVELPHSKQTPQVSASGHPHEAESIDERSIMHQAATDHFSVPLGKQRSGGKIQLWLVYPDVLGSRVRARPPKAPEWAGGILAYCEIEWQDADNDNLLGSIPQKRPTASTGFDWGTWSTTGRAKSRLAAD